MKRFWCLLGLLVFLAAVVFEVNEAAPEPKRRKGSSRKSSSSGSSNYPKQQYGNTGNTGYGSNTGNTGYGSNNNNNKNYGSNGNNNNNYGKKKKGMSTLKKAAVLGAVAYGSYQIGKMSSGYGGWNNHPRGYGFNQWNRDREIDGFMCRKTDDCSWMDRQLYCQDYELDFSPSRAWFGGDFASIIGECACPHGMYFDQREMYCRQNFMGSTFGIGMIVICVLVGLCCCCGCLFAANKMRG